MESLLTYDPPLIREACISMWGWYKDAMDRSPPPARVDISAMTEERVEVYWHVKPPVQPIPVGLQPFLVDDFIPEDEEIAWAVRRLCLNSSSVPSVIRAEHLRQWLHEATRDNALDSTNWQKFVYIVQEEFCNGTLAEESTWQTVVLIPKGSSGDFRGIGLVRVLWKAVTSLLNCWLVEAINFHDVLHGFW